MEWAGCKRKRAVWKLVCESTKKSDIVASGKEISSKVKR
jgi:hypothetical protein